jgi:hypothetical protein
MGWETRERGGRYYTRSRKVGGRVVREYVGAGPLAEAIAALDAAERAERAEAAERLRDARLRAAPAEAALAGFDQAVEVVARAALLGAGYRRHHRGEWRKRRGIEATEGPADLRRAAAAGGAGDPGDGREADDGTGGVAARAGADG